MKYNCAVEGHPHPCMIACPACGHHGLTVLGNKAQCSWCKLTLSSKPSTTKVLMMRGIDRKRRWKASPEEAFVALVLGAWGTPLDDALPATCPVCGIDVPLREDEVAAHLIEVPPCAAALDVLIGAASHDRPRTP